MTKKTSALRRRSVLILFLALSLLLSSCGDVGKDVPDGPGTDEEKETEKETGKETPPEEKNEPTDAPPAAPPVPVLPTGDTRTPAEVEDAGEIATLLLARIQTAAGYRREDSGTTVAKIGFIKYTQKISSLTVFSGKDFYNTSLSDSAIVHSSHEVRARNGVLTVTGENAPYTEDSYRAAFGIVPSDALLCRFVVNEDTLLSAEKIGQEGDVLTYRFVLSPAAAEGIRNQMQKFGGLKKLPVFHTIEITLQLKNDWTPLSTDLYAVYDIVLPVLGATTCTEQLHHEYTSYGKAEMLP